MADLFWSIATSYLALSALAALFLAAIAVGFVPLVGYLPVIGPYVSAAKLVSFLALAALSFLVGHRLADESAETRRLKLDLAFAQLQLNAQRQSADTAAALRAKAEAKALDLERKVTAYEDELAKQPAGNCALDDHDVNSLRGIAR